MQSKYIPIVLFLALALVSFKNVTPDSRLVDYLGQEKVDLLQKNNPDLIRYYNFYLDNSFIISEFPAAKSDNLYSEIEVPMTNGKVDQKKLNVLKLNIQRKYEERLYYKVKGGSQLIIFLSEKEFMEKYNQYRKKLGLIEE